jgi:hypothetical protein
VSALIDAPASKSATQTIRRKGPARVERGGI